MQRFFSALLVTLSIASITAGVAMASRFSDVSDTSLSRGAIERLADRGVITGNPDGTFAPNKTVNRAELLTMLYRAAKITPVTPQPVCKKDIIAGSWYLNTVCDAISRGFVNGYDDGTFRPGNAVNRVEAIKMIFTVFNLDASASTATDTSMIAFPDVSLSAWYAPYLAAAYHLSILPVPGQSANSFGPDQPLTRAEAALYIDSALSAHDPVMSSSSSSSSEASVSSTSSRSAISESSSSSISVKSVSLPMTENGTWSGKDPTVYRFSVSTKTIAAFTAQGMVNDTLMSCRLYKLDSNGLPTDYYMGFVSSAQCVIRVSMIPGDYQLELRGSSGVSYTLSSRTSAGDGNDSFTEAKTLTPSAARVSMLEVDDQADYYKFSVLGLPTSMMIEMSNTQTVRCTIIPQADVSLFGFAYGADTPECNKNFLFPTGTYILVIDRVPGIPLKQESYGVVLKKE